MGHQLFRDAYRIRAEDTFDLNYLYSKQPAHETTGRSDSGGQSAFGIEYPYRHFAARPYRASILCYRQIYEVLKRRDREKSR